MAAKKKRVENKAWALWYGAHGVHVFPCDPKNKQPIGYVVPCDPKIGPDGKQVRDKNGKRIGIKGTGGVKKATTDEATIRKWWTQRPDAMIGAATGSVSGFWAIDPDAPKQVDGGKPGELTPDGRITWANLKAHYGEHAPTLETVTPGGGNHIKFRFDPKHPLGNSEGDLADLGGINVRGTGGYVCIAPSARADGKAYIDNKLFDRSALADAPEWLYNLIKSKPNNTPPPPPPPPESELFPPGFGLDPLFPFTPANVAKLKAALTVIPATPRGTWFKVGGALHTLGSSWGDHRRRIWDEWSKTAPDYFDEADQEKTWNDFNGDRQIKTTVDWNFKEAVKHGWDQKKADYENIVAAIDAADVNDREVITSLCAMIAAAELKPGREDQLKEKILKKFKITNKLFDAIMTEEKKEHEENKRKNKKPHDKKVDIVSVGCIPRKVTTLDELNGEFGYIDVPGKANAFASCRDLKVIKKTNAMDRLRIKLSSQDMTKTASLSTSQPSNFGSKTHTAASITLLSSPMKSLGRTCLICFVALVSFQRKVIAVLS